MKRSVDRRGFLRGTLGSLGATIAARAGWLFPESRDVLTRARDATVSQPPVEGEIYEGFLLLPEEAPMPDFVQCAPAPILCQTDGQVDPAYRGESIRLGRIEELANYVSFPIYLPAALPPDMGFAGANILRFAQSGDIFVATINYGATGTGQSRLSMRARPIYPRPYPVWPVHSPVSHEKDIIYPEKVTFLPAPGIMRPSATGHVFNWIKHDILFTLIVEHGPNREAAVALAQSLVQK